MKAEIYPNWQISQPLILQKWQFSNFPIFQSWFHVKSEWQNNPEISTVWWCIAYVLLIWIRMWEIPKGCWKKITGSPTSFDLHPLIMELNAATQISLFGHPHITFWQKLLKVATTTLSLLLNGIQLSASHFYCEKEDIQSICTNYVNNAKYCGKRIYWSIHVVVGTYNAKQFLKGMDLNKSFKMHWNTLMQSKKDK